MKRFYALAGLLAVAGCQTSSTDVTQDPMLTPVGYGLMTPRDPLPTASASAGPHSAGSTAGAFGYSMFRDTRATRVGDVITVTSERDD